MPLSAGIATAGKTGALSLKSLASGGTQRNVPVAGFNVNISRGDDLAQLINNAAFAANKVVGISVGSFDIALPLIPAVLPADFFARAFGSVSGDTSAANYHIFTFLPDNAGSAAVVHSGAKFGRMQGGVQFATSGAASAVGLRMSGMILDPESTTATALSAPSSGALSTGGIKGFAQTTITGASQVVSVGWNVETGLVIAPGVAAGPTAYPYEALGLLMTTLDGTVSITQYRNATTVLGATGADGTLTLAFGTTGNGISFQFQVMPVSIGKPSSQGINYMTSSYRLKSVDGTTSPFIAADL